MRAEKGRVSCRAELPQSCSKSGRKSYRMSGFLSFFIFPSQPLSLCKKIPFFLKGEMTLSCEDVMYTDFSVRAQFTDRDPRACSSVSSCLRRPKLRDFLSALTAEVMLIQFMWMRLDTNWISSSKDILHRFDRIKSVCASNKYVNELTHTAEAINGSQRNNPLSLTLVSESTECIITHFQPADTPCDLTHHITAQPQLHAHKKLFHSFQEPHLSHPLF